MRERERESGINTSGFGLVVLLLNEVSQQRGSKEEKLSPQAFLQ